MTNSRDYGVLAPHPAVRRCCSCLRSLGCSALGREALEGSISERDQDLGKALTVENKPSVGWDFAGQPSCGFGGRGLAERCMVLRETWKVLQCMFNCYRLLQMLLKFGNYGVPHQHGSYFPRTATLQCPYILMCVQYLIQVWIQVILNCIKENVYSLWF